MIEQVIIYLLWYDIISWNVTDGWMMTSYLDINFLIPKILWDDTRSYNITDGWMLTASLNIQKYLLIFLNLTKLSQEQKLAQILYPSTYCVYYNI